MSMNIFSWDEVKSVGDCRRYMEEIIGAIPVGKKGGDQRSYNCPWRSGSDSGSFNVKADGWYDHVQKEGGTIIDLAARAKHAGNTFEACEWLGTWLHLQPRYKTTTKRSIVRIYDYVDLLGITVHQTVRYEPKDFRQRRPDPVKEGEYIYNLDGITPILYRLPEWHDKPWVLLVEGEKDADNVAALGLPVTTSPMGAGKWSDSFTESLRGKTVGILPDNDEPGRSHAELVASRIHGTAKAVYVVKLPGLPEKGDVSDWISAGGTAEQLKKLLNATKPYNPANAKPAQPEAKDEILEAKRANQAPFRNFRWEIGHTDGGKQQDIRVPIHVTELAKDLNIRFLGFPRLVGDTLFDHDRDNGNIRLINDPADLLAWVSEKSGQLVEWTRSEGAVSQDQFIASVRANAKRYQTVSGIPCWPIRHDVYYTHGKLPEPTPDARVFNEFLTFFNPEEEADAILLRAFFASPLFHRPGVHRPLWIIDSQHGQGSGKTTQANMLALLYGGDDPACSTPIGVNAEDLTNAQQTDRIKRRLMSSTGRQKRVFLVDNVEGYFRSSALATLLTEPDITGMAPYGKGEEHRPNDLTYCLTVNSATVSRDLISRALFIYVKPPDYTDNARVGWVGRVTNFIKANRLQIIADIIGIIQRKADYQFIPASRFADWEAEVMAPMCGTAQNYDTAWKAIFARRSSADGDTEDADAIRSTIITKLSTLGVNVTDNPVWITTDVLKRWSQEAVPGFGGKDSRGAVHAIKNMVKAKLIPEFGITLEKFPHNGNDRRRGLMWNYDHLIDPDYTGNVYLVKLDSDRVSLSLA